MLKSKAPGPTPSFTELPLIRAVEIFGDKEIGKKGLLQLHLAIRRNYGVLKKP
jgi:hypothetical protein